MKNFIPTMQKKRLGAPPIFSAEAFITTSVDLLFPLSRILSFVRIFRTFS
jgi:hypothetical protein